MAALAVSGLVAGHTVAYVVTVRDAQARLSLLARTGHSYWHAALAVAVVAGVTAGVARAGRSFMAGRRGDAAPSGGLLVVRLGSMQLLGFVLMETTERLAVHQPVSTVFDHHFLAIGLLAQLVLAVSIAAADRLLTRAAHSLGSACAHEATPWPRAQKHVAALEAGAPRPAPAVGGGSRAPPLLTA